MRTVPVSLVLLAALAVLLTFPDRARGQEIPRDEYLRQLPLSMPRLVPGPAATAELDLFGDPDDPAYRDVDPVDGIDDRRGRVLVELAVAFAPFLVQNTTDIPTNFEQYIRNRTSFPLFVDTWEISGEEPELVASKGVNLAVLGRQACPDRTAPVWDTHPEPTGDPAVEDCKLLQLMERYTPGTGRTADVDASRISSSPAFFEVLFLDFPGSGAGSWKEAYEAEYRATPAERRPSFPHAFVHPFARRVEEGGDEGYELLLQYWFFYPNNDSGMDHEGDWEHVNVAVSPRSMVEAPLTAATVREIVEGRRSTDPSSADPLVIRRIDYYFHESVFEADFSRPNAYLPRAEWEARVRALEPERLGQRSIWEEIRYRAWADDAETVVNTHPFGYVGSDNKGLNQALERPGGSNRDAHGTYPFPGRYANVGPGGTTDQVGRFVDHREYLAELAEGRADMGPDFRPGAVLGLADPARLRLLPPWERILDLAWARADVRRDWSWMLLPARWGYPATVSPFAGVLEHFNTGNVAPPGPSFNAGWSRSGASSGFAAYDPHSIPALFPLQVQDAYRNDLGFLNLTLPTLLNLPPLDFLSRLVAYPLQRLLGRRDPVFYPNATVPFRFVGISSGVSYQWLDEDYDDLSVNPLQLDEFVSRISTHIMESGVTPETEVVGGRDFQDDAVGIFFQVPFYLGGRFTSENMLRNVRSRFGAVIEFTDIPDYTYSASLNLWEYAGSIRYAFLTGPLQPYVKGGYGWAWQRLEDVEAVGVPFTPAESDWMGPGNVLPNVWHYGLGLEHVPFRRVGGVEIAVRAEFVRYSQSLGLDLSQVPLETLGTLFQTLADVPSAARVGRNDLLIGLALTF